MTKYIAFQGELGAYGHEACHSADPAMTPLPCKTFDDVITAMRTQRADLAVLPVENSTYGRVADIHRLLPESGLHIIGEVFIRVRISLMALPGVRLEDIQKVLSNKARYIGELLDDTLDLRKKTKDEINSLLEKKEYDKNNEDYKYLIKMPMDSVSIENVDKIMNDHYNKSKELDTIKTKKIENMWLDELKTLKQCYNEFLDESNINIQKNQKGKTKK